LITKGKIVAIKCPKCQTGNPDTQKFCGECATPLHPDLELSHTKTLETPTEELTSGSTFTGRYKIIEALGKGGMGTIYKVFDKNIQEEIALKLLKHEIAADDSMIERFRNELKIARKIAHKNVCRMYDLGKEGKRHFITMEYVDGKDLKSTIRKTDRLPEDKALSIAIEVCAGLAEAHELGVVHRDLKPQNIMIEKKGRAKILDFGIARSIEAKGVTQTGTMIGTPAYMSPEQVEGKETDQRSDIYSFGVVLYEMVTGKVPFTGESAFSVALKHKTEVPAAPKSINETLSDNLSETILKCMEKKREDRFQKAEELLDELKNIKIGKTISRRILPEEKPDVDVSIELKWKNSIAVLPLADLSQNRDQEYFCNGMTEDIITKLSRLPELKVISRTSVMRYKNTDKDIKDIGKELGVASILEGSIRKEQDNIRVSAQLIDMKDGFHLWADNYDRKLESVFDVQDEVSQSIAEALKVKLTRKEIEAIKKGRPKNIDAYEFYLRGMHFINSKYINSHREEDFKSAIEMFKNTLKIEPDYALAYMGFVWSYQHHYQITGNTKDLYHVKKNARTIYKIDPDLAEANAIIAWIHAIRHKYKKSYNFYKRALEINPNVSLMNHIIGLYFRNLGLLHQAIEYFSRSLELDPFYLPSHSLCARCSIYMGEYKKAAMYIEKSLEIEPENFWSLLDNCILNISLKKYDDAEVILAKAEKINPNYTSVKFYKALLFAAKGEKEKALSVRKNGAVYSLLGMKDEAVKYMNNQMKSGNEHFQYSYLPLTNSHFYDKLRDSTQFKEILKKQEKKYEARLKEYGDL
jgi:serine/threonine protein kinase